MSFVSFLEVSELERKLTVGGDPIVDLRTSVGKLFDRGSHLWGSTGLRGDKEHG